MKYAMRNAHLRTWIAHSLERDRAQQDTELAPTESGADSYKPHCPTRAHTNQERKKITVGLHFLDLRKTLMQFGKGGTKESVESRTSDLDRPRVQFLLLATKDEASETPALLTHMNGGGGGLGWPSVQQQGWVEPQEKKEKEEILSGNRPSIQISLDGN